MTSNRLFERVLDRRVAFIVVVVVVSACFVTLWLQSQAQPEQVVQPVLDLTQDSDLWRRKQAEGAEIRFLVDKPGSASVDPGRTGKDLPSKGEVKTLGPLDDRAYTFLRRSFSSSLLSDSKKLDALRADGQGLSEAERRAKEAKLLLSIVGSGIQLEMLASGSYWAMAYGDGPKHFFDQREGWSFTISPAPMDGRMIDVVFPIEMRRHAELTEALRQRSLGRYILAQERALEFNSLAFGERKALVRVMEADRAGQGQKASPADLVRARHFMVSSTYIEKPRYLMFARRPDR